MSLHYMHLQPAQCPRCTENEFEGEIKECTTCRVKNTCMLLYYNKPYCQDCWDYDFDIPGAIGVDTKMRCNLPCCEYRNCTQVTYMCTGCKRRNVHGKCMQTYWSGSATEAPHYYCFGCIENGTGSTWRANNSRKLFITKPWQKNNRYSTQGMGRNFDTIKLKQR